MNFKVRWHPIHSPLMTYTSRAVKALRAYLLTLPKVDRRRFCAKPAALPPSDANTGGARGAAFTTGGAGGNPGALASPLSAPAPPPSVLPSPPSVLAAPPSVLASHWYSPSAATFVGAAVAGSGGVAGVGAGNSLGPE